MAQSEPKELPVFSPTQTELWKECPIKRALERDEGIEYKYSRTTPAKVAGTGFHAGAALVHTYWKAHGSDAEVPPGLLQTAKEAAARSITTDDERYLEVGVTVGREDLIADVQKSLEKYVKLLPLKGYEILDVEKTLPDHGPCRIDLGLRRGSDTIVVDSKFKRQLKPEYRNKTVLRYLKSWQFHHYVWAYGECLNLPITHIGLLLIVGAPYSVALHTEAVDEDWQSIWLTSARQTWKDMQDERDGNRPIIAAASHENQYGPCEMMNLCFDHKLDIENALKGDYVRLRKRQKEEGNG